jgi:transcriptional regulator with XRE-family HTH domain/mannose-6-phosphate isomerase-like protein (cupin superfamily)
VAPTAGDTGQSTGGLLRTPMGAGAPDRDPSANLAMRLREARLRAGITVRELARQLGVSASFVSQLENGKSQPSVSTLYALAQCLGESIDRLFLERDEPTPPPPVPPGTEKHRDVPARARTGVGDGPKAGPVSVDRTRLGFPMDGWGDIPSGVGRVALTVPGKRARLVMGGGVIWEQLVPKTDHFDFMEIIYPPGSSSTNDGRMLRHDNYEYGYLLEGELEVTVGFEVFTLRAGEAIGFDSATPHLFKNLDSVPARGIWVVQHRLT